MLQGLCWSLAGLLLPLMSQPTAWTSPTMLFCTGHHHVKQVSSYRAQYADLTTDQCALHFTPWHYYIAIYKHVLLRVISMQCQGMARELCCVGIESKLLKALCHCFILAVKVLPCLLVIHIKVLHKLQEGTEPALLKYAHQT